jgi:serine/threonine protein kinase
MRQVYKEAIILGQLSHPNIVTLYGMVVDPEPSSRSSNKRGEQLTEELVGSVHPLGFEGQNLSLHGALVMELMQTDLAAYLDDNPNLSLDKR